MTAAGDGREAEIHPAFGAMRWWALVSNAPLEGAIEDRAASLWAIVDKHRERLAGSWPIKPQIIKGMTLELVAAFALAAKPLTPAALKLSAWAMDLPPTFLRNTFPLYSGRDGKGQGADPSLRALAELLDARSFYVFGKFTSINWLAKAVNVSRSTVRAWRSDAVYSDLVRLLSKDLDWAKVDESAKQGQLDLSAVEAARAHSRMAQNFELLAAEEGKT